MHPARRPTERRGVTLLEMLVVVALLVLMMLILASIFHAATGAMTAMRTYQELDDNLRLLDLTIRQDLAGVKPGGHRIAMGRQFAHAIDPFACSRRRMRREVIRRIAQASRHPRRLERQHASRRR